MKTFVRQHTWVLVVLAVLCAFLVPVAIGGAVWAYTGLWTEGYQTMLVLFCLVGAALFLGGALYLIGVALEERQRLEGYGEQEESH